MMDGLYQDIIIIMTIFAFSFWIIKKHYDEASAEDKKENDKTHELLKEEGLEAFFS